ncbi:MAG: TIM barrel protein [Acidobacteriaceae bacterium]|nr:TIM barrel protein [Acidobacteriaceae bacterium]
MPLSRRELLILLPALAFADSSSEPHAQFPVEPRARLAVTSWPFRAYIESPTNHGRKSSVPGMDLKEFPAFVVDKFGVHNINPLADHFNSTDDVYLAAFREAVDKAGSHVVDLGLGGRYFYDPDPTARQTAVDYGRKWIDIAVKIGSPSVRQHLQVRHGQKPDPAMAAESLRQLADYGAKRNVVVNLENDNPIAEDPFVLVSVIEKVNAPYLRALPDFGNSLGEHDEDYNEGGVKAMLAHAWNMCHVKDSVEGENGQRKNVDLARMFGLAKQSSYRGYYSMEFDTNAGDPIVGTQKLVQESLQYLA